MNFRRRIENLPLKRKLLFGTLATCMVALALACAALFWFQSVNFRRGFSAELESLGAIIAQNSAAPLAFDDRKSAVEVLNSLRVKPDITFAALYDREGKLFAHMGTEPAPHRAALPPVAPGVTFDRGYAHLSLPVMLDGGRSGHIDLGARFADRYRSLLSLYTAVLAAVLGGALVLIFIMTSALQRLITRPVIALAEVAQSIGEREDYAVRAPEGASDEVGLLARNFNRMLAQIQSRDLALQESRQRFEIAVLGSSDGLWDWDLVTNAVYFSPRWKSMLGFGDGELSNEFETFRRLLHPDDVPLVLARVEDYLKGGAEAYQVEFRARHKDGADRWILSRGAALRDSQGKAVRFAGSHTDITERKKSEEQIRLAREKFESLVNSINGIVWEADPCTSQCLFINEQAERILGYPVARWLAEPGFSMAIVHPDDRDATRRASRRGMACGVPFQLEHRVFAADGRVVWLRESVAVERKAAGTLLMRGLAIDITEQKLAAEQIARMQRELVDASRLAGMAEVATGVLHNVGNVLNSVNLSVGIVVEQLRKSKTASLARAVGLLRNHEHDAGEFLTNDPKGKQLPAYFAAIAGELAREQATLSKEAQGLQKNVEHIKQIVAMQQSYAKVSGALERLPPHELAEDALRMASSALARHRIEIVRQFDPVPAVTMDRHRVLQILVNVLHNAKQALDGRAGERKIVLRIARGENACVLIEVTDNGVGIPKENLTRIFSYGFTTKKTGHGFGLHSGANAAKEMGGSLRAHSAGIGAGATFVLELPLAPSDEQRKAA